MTPARVLTAKPCLASEATLVGEVLFEYHSFGVPVENATELSRRRKTRHFGTLTQQGETSLHQCCVPFCVSIISLATPLCSVSFLCLEQEG